MFFDKMLFEIKKKNLTKSHLKKKSTEFGAEHNRALRSFISCYEKGNGHMRIIGTWMNVVHSVVGVRPRQRVGYTGIHLLAWFKDLVEKRSLFPKARFPFFFLSHVWAVFCQTWSRLIRGHQPTSFKNRLRCYFKQDNFIFTFLL